MMTLAAAAVMTTSCFLTVAKAKERMKIVSKIVPPPTIPMMGRKSK